MPRPGTVTKSAVEIVDWRPQARNVLQEDGTVTTERFIAVGYRLTFAESDEPSQVRNFEWKPAGRDLTALQAMETAIMAAVKAEEGIIV